MLIEREDGFINATEMCIESRRHLSTYLRSKSSCAFIEAVCNKTGKTREELIKSSRGRGNATWVHPAIAVDIAHWIGADSAAEASLWVHEKRLEALQKADEAIKELRTAECQIPALKEAYEAGKTNADLIHEIHRAKHRCDSTKEYDRMLYRNHCNTLIDLLKDGVSERIVRTGFNLLNDTFRSWTSLHKPNDAEYHDHWHTFEQTVASMVKVSKIA